MPKPEKVSAADKLKTLDLYFELASGYEVAERLGISRYTVTNRLKAMGVTPRPRGSSIPAAAVNDARTIKKLRRRLLQEIEKEKLRPVSGHHVRSVSAEQNLATILLYREFNSSYKVADNLGIAHITVVRRLKSLGLKSRPIGSRKISFDEINGKAAVEAVIAKLRAEIGD